MQDKTRYHADHSRKAIEGKSNSNSIPFAASHTPGVRKLFTNFTFEEVTFNYPTRVHFAVVHQVSCKKRWKNCLGLALSFGKRTLKWVLLSDVCEEDLRLSENLP